MRRSEQQDPLTYQIIGAGIEVHKVLGSGLLERVYEDAICIELAERNLHYERQKPINLTYKDHIIGDLVADLVIEDRVIVELKAVEKLLPVHTAQLMTYLKLTNLNLGLLMNFNFAVLTDGVKRIICNFSLCLCVSVVNIYKGDTDYVKSKYSLCHNICR